MDVAPKSKWKRFGEFLRKKYRLVILNDSTFGEKFSLRLSPWGIIVGILAVTIVMTTAVISLVAFTPLREYIPGYGNIAERKQIVELSLRADSLEQALDARDEYLSGVLNVLKERPEEKSEKPKKDTTGKYAKLNTKPSEVDLQFRQEYEQGRQENKGSFVRIKSEGSHETIFFTPVKGLVSSSFNLVDNHFGVDIVTRQDEAIKSTLDGTIIFTGFSAQDGNVIHIQHNNNITSIYKHCSAVLKQTGERVKSGDAIAVVGNTGEKSNGPHLHFELWFNGAPVNPQEFVAF